MTASAPPAAGSVKICGLSDEAAIEACVEAGVDHVGFVFHPASPRAVSPDRAAALARRLPAGIGRVGLFVGADPGRIAAALDAIALDALQVYDTAARLAALRRRTDRPLWHALPIAGPADLSLADPDCALLVVEARAPAGADRPGGHGIALDWDRLGAAPPARAWMLAGGLAPDNVGEAIARSGARAVDVSSGVERSRGIKDRALILRFAAEARRAFARRTRHDPVEPGAPIPTTELRP